MTEEDKSASTPEYTIPYRLEDGFQEPYPRLFITNEVGSTRKPLLKSTGITHILVAGFGLGKHYPKDFEYKKLGIVDISGADLTGFFKEAFAFIDDALANSENKVLVHCASGVSRSASIVIGYIMYKTRRSYAHVYTDLRKLRPIVSPNSGFEKQLREFESSGFVVPEPILKSVVPKPK